MKPVALVHLRRPGALGLQRRLEAWEAIVAAAGREAVRVDLSRLPGVPGPRPLRDLLRGEVVPESLLWSRGGLRRLLLELDPHLVVFVTARAFDVRCVPRGAGVVLDLVDVLSENYRMRCTSVASPVRRVAFAGLRGSMRRFEDSLHGGVTRTAAGYADAQQLGITWVPNVHVPQPRPPAAQRLYDVVFHGSLRYEPNVEALLAFRSAWTALRRRRPGARMLVAGAQPDRRTTAALTAVEGWTVLPDFTSVGDVLASARVAVAPLLSATGFQNKVLETAAHGVPQVVSPAARRGLDPAFPLRTAHADQEWVEAVCGLLEDEGAAARLGADGVAHVTAHYRPEAYVSCV